MIQLPVINLPTELTNLLKMNFHGGENQSKVIMDKISQNKGLVYQLEDLFAEFDDQKRLPHVLQKISWTNFRDGFGSLYVYHAHHGKFPRTPAMNFIGPIHKIEDEFGQYTTMANSRLFLLGLYLELAQIKIRDELRLKRFDIYDFTGKVKILLKKTTSRTERLDWLILVIWHLCEFLDNEKIASMVKGQDFNYEKFYSELTEKQKELMLSNFLSYSCSIDEYEPFLNETV